MFIKLLAFCSDGSVPAVSFLNVSHIASIVHPEAVEDSRREEVEQSIPANMKGCNWLAISTRDRVCYGVIICSLSDSELVDELASEMSAEELKFINE